MSIRACRLCFRVLAALVLASLSAGAALGAEPAAQDYPSKPVRLIISFPQGSSDVLGRAFAQYAALGQPVVVENVTGANGAIGLSRLAKSAPDGYTIAVGATTNLAVSPHLNSKLPYDPLKDFTPIALLARVPIVLVVSGSVPARSVEELVALARAHPGKLNYGSIGAGSTGHLLGEMLRRLAGINVVHVPYKGAAPSVTALLAGDVQFMFFPVFVDARAQVRSAALRPLALVDSRRSPVAPDLPTLPELGYPLEASAWFALIAPAGTPDPIVQRLAAEVKRVLSLEKMRRFLDDHGIEAGDMGPEAVKAYIAEEHARYGRMVRETGVRVE
jgi:tripartite-type tricarboxylate transporter receptor subunit TctC